MKAKIINMPSTIFSSFKTLWENKFTQRALGILMAAVFLGMLILITLKNAHLLPEVVAIHIPSNYFQAITIAFHILLLTEIIGLILIMGTSMSRSVGRELEIIALIMVRNVFKTLGELSDPINLFLDREVLVGVASHCVAALLIFIVAALYHHIQSTKCPGSEDPEPLAYASAKKWVALILLVMFFLSGGLHISAIMHGSSVAHEQSDFFAHFYTMLIFADLFLLLASESTMHNPILLFRNSGYTAGAVLMRMSLGAPDIWDASLATFAAIYILAISYAVRKLRLKCGM